MYTGIVPNVLMWVAFALTLVGIVHFLREQDRLGKTAQGARRIARAYGLVAGGIVALILAMWIDGSNSLTGRIIATVTATVSLVFVMRVVLRLVRRSNRGDPEPEPADT